MRAALFGLGYWGQKLHAILDDAGVEVVVVDPGVEEMAARGRAAQSFRFSTATAAFADPGIDICVIASPEETHFKLALSALEAGKSVFVEKPLCLYRHQAHQLIQAARENQACLFVDYTFLYDPAVHQLQTLLHSGAIGQLQTVESWRLSSGIHKPLISVFADLAPHDLYLFRSFFEREIAPELLHVSFKDLDAHNSKHGTAEYRSQSGQVFRAHYSWVAPAPVRRMEFTGSAGQIIWQKEKTGEVIQVLPYFEGQLSQPQAQQQSAELQFASGRSLPAAVDHFLCLLRGEEEQARQLRYQHYLTDVAMLESICEAHSTI